MHNLCAERTEDEKIPVDSAQNRVYIGNTI